MFGGYGPLGSLSKQLQMSFAFDMITRELISDFEALRKVRNDLSHSWDVSDLVGFYKKGHATSLFPIEELLREHANHLCRFRLRLVWMVARLTYEALLYAKARQAKLDPSHALYGPNRPKLLESVSKLAMEACRRCIGGDAKSS